MLAKQLDMRQTSLSSLGINRLGQANEDRDPGEVSGLQEHELAWAWQRKEAGFEPCL